MIFVIGGAYQGKLDFVREVLGVSGIYTCTGPEIDFSRPCIYQIEEFTARHPAPVSNFREHREQ